MRPQWAGARWPGEEGPTDSGPSVRRHPVDDKILRQCIIDELDFDPRIHSANIGVAVDGGVVTLTGHVPTYPQKTFAEQAAKRVKGVRGLAEELKVQFAGADAYS